MSARETVERLWDDAGKDHSYTVDIAHMEKFARAVALHLAGLCEMVKLDHKKSDLCRAHDEGVDDAIAILKKYAGELT